MQTTTVTIIKVFYSIPFVLVAMNNAVSDEYEYFKLNKQQNRFWLNITDLSLQGLLCLTSPDECCVYEPHNLSFSVLHCCCY